MDGFWVAIAISYHCHNWAFSTLRIGAESTWGCCNGRLCRPGVADIKTSLCLEWICKFSIFFGFAIIVQLCPYICIYITLYNFLYFILIYVYIYTRTHVYMDHQREVSLQTLMALGNLERWSTCHLLSCEARQQMPQNLEARHRPMPLGSFRNHGVISWSFIRSYTFIRWMCICICIYIYMYLYMSLVQ